MSFLEEALAAFRLGGSGELIRPLSQTVRIHPRNDLGPIAEGGPGMEDHRVVKHERRGSRIELQKFPISKMQVSIRSGPVADNLDDWPRVWLVSLV